MARRNEAAKPDPKLCTKDFTPEQRTELSNDVWKFLFAHAGGNKNAVYELKPAKVYDAAFDFVGSDIGQSYWPISPYTKLLQAEATQDELVSYVNDLMTKRRKKETDDDPFFKVDYEPTVTTPTAPRKPIQTPKTTKLARKEAQTPKMQKLSTTKARSERQTNTAAVSFSQDSYIPPAGERSPTFAPDIPYREASVPQKQMSPKLPFKVTAASRKIAEEAFDEFYDDHAGAAPAEGESITVVQTTEPILLDDENVPSKSKRPAESTQEPGPESETVVGPGESPYKRRALGFGISGSPRREPGGEMLLATTLTPASPAASMLPPPSSAISKQQIGSASREGSTDTSTGLHRAFGLSYTPENLARIPRMILDYLDECHDENYRTMQESETPEQEKHFDYRASIFRDIAKDLESRMKSLAELEGRDRDRKEGPRVVTSYSLRASKRI